MKNKILVSVAEDLEEFSWLKKVKVFSQKVLQEIEEIEKMSLEKSAENQEVSILFCRDSFIQNLNRDYRQIDSPTDVLSFENGTEYFDEDNVEWKVLGDIAISLETLPKNAEYFEVSQDEELRRLLVHGLLHLSGYDHGEEHVEKNKEPVCKMLKIQKIIMENLKNENILSEDLKI